MTTFSTRLLYYFFISLEELIQGKFRSDIMILDAEKQFEFPNFVMQ